MCLVKAHCTHSIHWDLAVDRSAVTERDRRVIRGIGYKKCSTVVRVNLVTHSDSAYK